MKCDFFMPIHPSQMERLKSFTARDKYKHEQHVIRYNRWAESQGKPAHREAIGEVGTFEGVNWI